MLTMTNIDNELIRQKDGLYAKLNELQDIQRNNQFLRNAQQLFAILQFIRTFWLALSYGYKWEEVVKALQDRCQYRLDSIAGQRGTWRAKHDLAILIDQLRAAGNDNWRERSKQD